MVIETSKVLSTLLSKQLWCASCIAPTVHSTLSYQTLWKAILGRQAVHKVVVSIDTHTPLCIHVGCMLLALP